MSFEQKHKSEQDQLVVSSPLEPTAQIEAEQKKRTEITQAMQPLLGTPLTAQRKVLNPIFQAATLQRQEALRLTAEQQSLQRQIDTLGPLPQDAVQQAIQRQLSAKAPAESIKQPKNPSDWVTVMRQVAAGVDGKGISEREAMRLNGLQGQVANSINQSYRQDRQTSEARNTEYGEMLASLHDHPRSQRVSNAVLGMVPKSDQPKLQRALDEALQRKQDLVAQDQVALQVHALQRKQAELKEQEKQPIAERIQAKQGSGNPLSQGVQKQLEQGLNHDMSKVRVHDDAEADKMAKSVNAVAFTSGADIFFQSGKYDPNSKSGVELLAHEATHTVQQAQGKVGPGIDPDAGLEQEAQNMGKQVAAGVSESPETIAKAPAVPTSSTGKAGIQRREAEGATETEKQGSNQQNTTGPDAEKKEADNRPANFNSVEALTSQLATSAEASAPSTETESAAPEMDIATQAETEPDLPEPEAIELQTDTPEVDLPDTPEPALDIDVPEVPDMEMAEPAAPEMDMAAPEVPAMAPSEATSDESESVAANPAIADQALSDPTLAIQRSAAPAEQAADPEQQLLEGGLTRAQAKANAQQVAEAVAEAATSAAANVVGDAQGGAAEIVAQAKAERQQLITAGQAQAKAVRATAQQTQQQIKQAAKSSTAEIQSKAKADLSKITAQHTSNAAKANQDINTNRNKMTQQANQAAQQVKAGTNKTTQDVKNQATTAKKQVNSGNKASSNVAPEVAAAKAKAGQQIADDAGKTLTSGGHKIAVATQATGTKAATGLKQDGVKLTQAVGTLAPKVQTQLNKDKQTAQQALKKTSTQANQEMNKASNQANAKLMSSATEAQSKIKQGATQQASQLQEAGHEVARKLKKQGSATTSATQAAVLKIRSKLANSELTNEDAAQIKASAVASLQQTRTSIAEKAKSGSQKALSALQQQGKTIAGKLEQIAPKATSVLQEASGKVTTTLKGALNKVTPLLAKVTQQHQQGTEQTTSKLSSQLAAKTTESQATFQNNQSKLNAELTSKIGEEAPKLSQAAGKATTNIGTSHERGESQAKAKKEALDQQAKEKEAEAKKDQSLWDKAKGWVGSAWEKISSWVSEQWKQAVQMFSSPGFIAGLVTGLVLGAGLLVLTIATGGLALPMLIAAGAAIGAISSGVGTVVDNIAAGNKWHQGLLKSVALGGLMGAGGAALVAAAPVALSGVIVGGIGLSGGMGIVSNVMTGQPWDQNLLANVALGGVMAFAGKKLPFAPKGNQQKGSQANVPPSRGTQSQSGNVTSAKTNTGLKPNQDSQTNNIHNAPEQTPVPVKPRPDAPESTTQPAQENAPVAKPKPDSDQQAGPTHDAAEQTTAKPSSDMPEAGGLETRGKKPQPSERSKEAADQYRADRQAERQEAYEQSIKQKTDELLTKDPTLTPQEALAAARAQHRMGQVRGRDVHRMRYHRDAPTGRTAKIDELTGANYTRLARERIASQNEMYRYTTRKTVDDYYMSDTDPGIRRPSYMTDEKFNTNFDSMDRAQVAPEWGVHDVGIAVPSNALVGDPIVPRPFGNSPHVKMGWEPFTKAYPEYGRGGALQFLGKTESFDPAWVSPLDQNYKAPYQQKSSVPEVETGQLPVANQDGQPLPTGRKNTQEQIKSNKTDIESEGLVTREQAEQTTSTDEQAWGDSNWDPIEDGPTHKKVGEIAERVQKTGQRPVEGSPEMPISFEDAATKVASEVAKLLDQQIISKRKALGQAHGINMIKGDLKSIKYSRSSEGIVKHNDSDPVHSTYGRYYNPDAKTGNLIKQGNCSEAHGASSIMKEYNIESFSPEDFITYSFMILKIKRSSRNNYLISLTARERCEPYCSNIPYHSSPTDYFKSKEITIEVNQKGD